MLKETKAVLLIGAFLLAKNSKKLSVDDVFVSKKSKKKDSAVPVNVEEPKTVVTETPKVSDSTDKTSHKINPSSLAPESIGTPVVTDTPPAVPEPMDISQAFATFSSGKGEDSDISRAYATFTHPNPAANSRPTPVKTAKKISAEEEALQRKQQAEEFERVLRERSINMRRKNFYEGI